MLLRGRGREFELGRLPLVMGILNATPDSFFDGGRFLDPAKAVGKGLKMAREGAGIIDVGGESTRPGAEAVPMDEELRRVIPVVEGLSEDGIAVSIDTTKAEVARKAIDAGAFMVNDVSAMTADPDMAGVVSETGAAVVLMHMRGNPRTMQEDVEYADIIGEVRDYLAERLASAAEAGIKPERTVVDPGIGFGKPVDGNLDIIRGLSAFLELGRPVLLGPSRKSFIGAVLNDLNDGADDGPEVRLAGTLAASVAGVLNGASILRVHDVRETVEAVSVAALLRRQETEVGVGG